MSVEQAIDEFEKDIESKINQRRRQMLIHSCLYYRMGTSIIDDATFDEWAYELVRLQEAYPDIAKRCVYAADFEGFDGTTGFDLESIYSPHIVAKAEYILKIDQKLKETGGYV